MELTLEELAKAADVTKRTLKYYVQIGVVDPPFGETKNARYGLNHVDQVRTVKRLQAEGLTLAKIALLKGEKPGHERAVERKKRPKQPRQPVRKVSVEILPGIEMSFTPDQGAITDEFIAEVSRKVHEVVCEQLDKDGVSSQEKGGKD